MTDINELMEAAAFANEFFSEQLQRRTDKNVFAYIEQRRLGSAISPFGLGHTGSDPCGLVKAARRESTKIQNALQQLGLISRDERGREYDFFRHRLMFPVRDPNGQTVGFGGRVIVDETGPKYINSPDSPIFHKSQILYGLSESRKLHSTSVVLCEGYIDVASLGIHQIGAVAPMGTALTHEQMGLLLNHYQRVVFCFDGDGAGHTAAARALDVALPLLNRGIDLRFILLEDGHDPDSYVRTFGAEAFVEQMNRATPIHQLLHAVVRRELNVGTLHGRAIYCARMAEKLAMITCSHTRQIIARSADRYIQTAMAWPTATEFNLQTAIDYEPVAQ